MSWWQRQRGALVILAITAALVIATIWVFEVIPSRDEPGPSVTAATSTVTVGGNTVSPPTVRIDEFAGPAGTTTLSVRVAARSDDDATSCGNFTLTEQRTGRVWGPAGDAVDVSYDDHERSCEPGSASYTILTVFLLPADVSGALWYDMPVDDSIARFGITV